MKVTWIIYQGRKWADVEQLAACLRDQDSHESHVIIEWLSENYDLGLTCADASGNSLQDSAPNAGVTYQEAT